MAAPTSNAAELVDPIAHGTESRCLFNKGGAVPPNRNDESRSSVPARLGGNAEVS
jgi:hypothetical protein